MNELIGYFILALVISFIIFLILRELMCWYYKINKIVSLLEEISSRLSGVRISHEGIATAESKIEGQTISCANCGKPISLGDKFCPYCGTALN